MIEHATMFKDLLKEHFVIDDWQAVDILLAMVLCHKVPHTEMLWLRLIGASGTGKTELLRAIQAVSYTEKAEHLTPAALRGGYVPKGRRAKMEPMLLERVNGKLLITKEFASILTAKKEDRTQVLGILRSVYDGSFDSDFGGEQRHLHQESHFDWIIGTTAYVDQQRQLEAQLGSRFVDLRWKTPVDGELLGKKAITNDKKLTAIREKLGAMLHLMAEMAEPCEGDTSFVPPLAVFASKYRTPLQRDARTREIMEVPEHESPARLAQAFARLTNGLAMLGVESPIPFIKRIALDTLPKTRAAFVKALMAGVRGRNELAEACGVSQGAMTYIREEMRMLGFDENEPLDFLNGGVNA